MNELERVKRDHKRAMRRKRLEERRTRFRENGLPLIHKVLEAVVAVFSSVKINVKR